ncbi:MAG: phenylalanyl-tRNA synthetase subunit beta [uncultured bacterium]|nr:MAG: phenylalanyl-tRNA synthetase subunit beta [uncultured bacterium]
MKISELWLREWVNPALNCEELSACLTMAGLEIEIISPAIESASECVHPADHIIDVAITPNRGDCLSALGLAQEIAALTQTTLHTPTFAKIDAKIKDALPVVIHEPEKCAHYVGRIIRGVAVDTVTPLWMQERLRRSEIKCIHPIVDVMNYVMVELGQPMHAFDLAKITGGIQVRLAKAQEKLELLDGQTVDLDKNVLVIADQQKPLAIAGVMGGLESSVTLKTTDIFLESAFFQPITIAHAVRHYKLNSESSYRFERGIDPLLQVHAIERATQLILEIAGGQPGPIVDVQDDTYLPQPKIIPLRIARVSKMLGIKMADHDIEAILQRLGFSIHKMADSWQVTAPARRFDITAEIDLIEEIGRLYHYENIPSHDPVAAMRINLRSEKKIYLSGIRNTLCDMGYQEVITYSFVDKKMQDLLEPRSQPKELLNPITADMSVMRTSLWPGLINTLIFNQNRQQHRVRIFETGLRFILNKGKLEQQKVLSALSYGSVLPEQWGVPTRQADFFDLKGDLENIFKLTFASNEFEFRQGSHPALHPGQTAEIYRQDEYVGIIGTLHPTVMQVLDVRGPMVLFEVLLDQIEIAKVPHFTEISKFPEIRRDIAILVDRTVPACLIQDTITHIAGELLGEITVFDVYEGKGIPSHSKSIALSLILQHPSRTLVDEEITDLMEHIVVALKEKFAAKLRG